MPSKDSGDSRRVSNRRRRQFLQGIGATGIAGVLAGCLGDDDSNGDDEENGDDGDDESATFEVSGLEAGEEVSRGESVTVTATIENTGDEDGTQEVALVFRGETEATEELPLGGGESDDVTFEVDTADLDPDDYEYAVETDDDEATATLTVAGALGDDPDPLVSIDESEVGIGTQTLNATVQNPYAVEIGDGSVELVAPEGWDVTPESGTEFETLAAADSQDAAWELEVPADAEGEYELTADVSYASGTESADVSTSLSITVDVWNGIEFVDVLHFEDVYDGIEDRAQETDDGELIEGQPGWYEYEVDLSAFLPATAIQLQIEDAYTDDGWGPSVQETLVYADGEEIHAIESATEEEEAYLVEDNSQIDDFSEEDDQWRFADGNASNYWIYEFDVPEDAETLTVRFEMRNGFYITGRALSDADVEAIDAVASAPYGINVGGEPDDPASAVPVEVDGLAFVDAPDPVRGAIPHARVTHGEIPDEFDWFTPPAGVADDSDAVDSIADTDHDALYQTEFHGPGLGFEIFIENGVYDVTLHFAETADHLEEGDRVFDLSVQGEPVVEELDIAAEVGHNTAYTVTVEEVAVEHGRLVIDSAFHEDLTKYCAVEVRWGGDPLERDLAAHYPLDGDEPTDAAGGADGTIEGDVSAGAEGVVGDAFQFEGGYVDLPEFGADGSVSVSLWANPDSWRDERTELTYWGDDPPNFEMSINGGDLDPFYWDGSDVRGPGTLDEPVPTGEWTHYVLAYDDDDGTWTAYVDGEAVATVEDAVDANFDGAENRLGDHPSLDRQFDGRLDDVRFYTRALTAEDVQLLYDLAEE